MTNRKTPIWVYAFQQRPGNVFPNGLWFDLPHVLHLTGTVVYLGKAFPDPTCLGYGWKYNGECISPVQRVLSECTSLWTSKCLREWNVHIVSNRWLIGAFQRKGSHPPAPRGAESEGASVLCNRTEEAAGVSRLDLISGTRPIKLKKEKGGRDWYKVRRGWDYEAGMHYPRLRIMKETFAS